MRKCTTLSVQLFISMKIHSEAVVIDGPTGSLEAIVDKPETISHNFISVNCHPHSLHGGTMTNKVVHTVSRTIAGMGIPSLRFNFRGVGKSEGTYDEGQGEQSDLLAVVEWFRQTYPEYKLILSGFSFGSFVSAMASPAVRPDFLISVAPPVKRFDFDGFERPKCDWAVIMGTNDELVDYIDVQNWVGSFSKSPSLVTMADASHFFHGRLIELREQVEALIGKHMSGELV